MMIKNHFLFVVNLHLSVYYISQGYLGCVLASWVDYVSNCYYVFCGDRMNQHAFPPSYFDLRSIFGPDWFVDGSGVGCADLALDGGC